jgi:hypothetical protein
VSFRPLACGPTAGAAAQRGRRMATSAAPPRHAARRPLSLRPVRCLAVPRAHGPARRGRRLAAGCRSQARRDKGDRIGPLGVVDRPIIGAGLHHRRGVPAGRVRVLMPSRFTRGALAGHSQAATLRCRLPCSPRLPRYKNRQPLLARGPFACPPGEHGHGRRGAGPQLSAARRRGRRGRPWHGMHALVRAHRPRRTPASTTARSAWRCVRMLSRGGRGACRRTPSAQRWGFRLGSSARPGQGRACLLALASDYLRGGGRIGGQGLLVLCHVLLVCTGHVLRVMCSNKGRQRRSLTYNKRKAELDVHRNVSLYVLVENSVNLFTPPKLHTVTLKTHHD